MVTDITLRTKFIDSDPIIPSLIEHKVEEIYVDGQIEQNYNFIDYWFDGESGRSQARVYLHASHEASIRPPIRPTQDGKSEIEDDWNNRDAIVQYLSRRFFVIKVLGPEGYKPIWMAAETKRYFDYRGWKIDDANR